MRHPAGGYYPLMVWTTLYTQGDHRCPCCPNTSYALRAAEYHLRRQHDIHAVYQGTRKVLRLQSPKPELQVDPEEDEEVVDDRQQPVRVDVWYGAPLCNRAESPTVVRPPGMPRSLPPIRGYNVDPEERFYHTFLAVPHDIWVDADQLLIGPLLVSASSNATVPS